MCIKHVAATHISYIYSYTCNICVEYIPVLHKTSYTCNKSVGMCQTCFVYNLGDHTKSTNLPPGETRVLYVFYMYYRCMNYMCNALYSKHQTCIT